MKPLKKKSKESTGYLYFASICIDFFYDYDILLLTKTTRPGAI